MNYPIKGMVTLADFDTWLDAQMDGADTPIDVDSAKRYVPLLRRAQNKRAGAVMGVPYEILDGENDVSEKPRFAQLPGLIYKTEMALCAYGKAYLAKTRNAGGFVWPEWYDPRTIYIVTVAHKFVGFERKVGTWCEPLATEDVLYFWQPDEDVEVGPGQAPMDAAQYAASALHNADKTLYNYFARGAVRTTIFAVPQATSEDEIKKLKSWWERIGLAVRNAYNTVFYRGNKLEPTVIGDPLSEIWSAELSADKREDIAAAMDIPTALLLSDSANFATAQEERAQWYQDFVFPRCAWFADTINAQWLSAEGLKMVYHPEHTEVWQTMQLGQVDKAVAALQIGIITVDEARKLLGFAERAAAQQPALPVAAEPEAREAPAEQAPPLAEGVEKALQADLEKWERYARKRYAEAHAEKALLFESAAIPLTLQASIRGALQAVQEADAVGDVFRSARAWAGYGFYPEG
jgi:hypothetical protein